MSNWKFVNKVYIYDGTFDGFLTIVFLTYSTKSFPQKIFVRESYLPNFLDKIINIETDFEKSKRIFNGIEKNIGYDTLYNVYYAFLSNEKDKEMYLLKYICEGFDIGPKVNNRITISYVFKVINMKKKVINECHKLKGLLRFQEIKTNSLYYASIHPDNNVIELLGHHFINRFPSQNFIIHDKNHNICLLYNSKEYKIIDATNLQIPDVTQEELKYQELWKLFFNTIAIQERKNTKCQTQFMPKKYWKDLIEDP